MAHGLASGVSEETLSLPLILLCMLRMATRNSWKYPIWVAGCWLSKGLEAGTTVLRGINRGLWGHCGAFSSAIQGGS